MKSYVVIDTNVPLLNNSWYENYKGKIIVLPFTVISEIDTKKGSMGVLGINARNVARLIGRISEQSKYSEDGIVELEEGSFMIYIPHLKNINGVASEVLDFAVNDDKIIYSAIEIKINNPESDVTLISNDCNVRSKILNMYKTYGVDSKAYSEDEGFKARDFYRQYTYEATDEMLSKFYSQQLSPKEVDESLVANNPVTLLQGKTELLGRVDPKGEFIKPLSKKDTYKISGFKPANSNQKHLVSMALDKNIKIVSVIGRTGSGKSLTVVASALHLLDMGICSKVKLIKPYEPMGNSVGMLKGSWEDKISPIRKTFIPIFNMLGRDLDEMEDSGQVEFTTPEFERGENYFSTALIISEAQNMSSEIKALITRANEGCFTFVEGDSRQVDSRFLSEDSNGLSNLINKLNGQEFFSHIYLDKSERADYLNIVDDLL